MENKNTTWTKEMEEDFRAWKVKLSSPPTAEDHDFFGEHLDENGIIRDMDSFMDLEPFSPEEFNNNN